MIDSIALFISQALGMEGQHFTTLVVGTVLFFLLFIDFGIILKNFTSFSSFVAWIMALGLCIIGTASGMISFIVLPLVEAIGFIGATLVLIGAKVGASVAELMVAQRTKSQKRIKEEIEKKSAEKMFKEVGKKIIKKAI